MSCNRYRKLSDLSGVHHDESGIDPAREIPENLLCLIPKAYLMMSD